ATRYVEPVLPSSRQKVRVLPRLAEYGRIVLGERQLPGFRGLVEPWCLLWHSAVILCSVLSELAYASDHTTSMIETVIRNHRPTLQPSKNPSHVLVPVPKRVDAPTGLSLRTLLHDYASSRQTKALQSLATGFSAQRLESSSTMNLVVLVESVRQSCVLH